MIRITYFGMAIMAICSTVIAAPVAQNANFEHLWGGVSATLDMLNKTNCDQRCENAVAVIREVKAGYDADPSDADVPALAKAFRDLDSVLSSSANHRAGKAIAQKAWARQSKLLPPREPMPLDAGPGGEEACLSACDRAFALVALICAAVPPPFDVGCIAGATASYFTCILACESGKLEILNDGNVPAVLVRRKDVYV